MAPSFCLLQLLEVCANSMSMSHSVFIGGMGGLLHLIYFVVVILQDFVKKLQCKQASVTAITERVNKLTKKQESPEHKEISHLNDQWLDLCLQANSLCLQREEDLQRTRDYHDRMNVVEEFLEKFTTEWDNLAR